MFHPHPLQSLLSAESLDQVWSSRHPNFSPLHRHEEFSRNFLRVRLVGRLVGNVFFIILLFFFPDFGLSLLLRLGCFFFRWPCRNLVPLRHYRVYRPPSSPLLAR